MDVNLFRDSLMLFSSIKSYSPNLVQETHKQLFLVVLITMNCRSGTVMGDYAKPLRFFCHDRIEFREWWCRFRCGMAVLWCVAFWSASSAEKSQKTRMARVAYVPLTFTRLLISSIRSIQSVPKGGNASQVSADGWFQSPQLKNCYSWTNPRLKDTASHTLSAAAFSSRRVHCTSIFNGERSPSDHARLAWCRARTKLQFIK
jgi:hypothetical protein